MPALETTLCLLGSTLATAATALLLAAAEATTFLGIPLESVDRAGVVLVLAVVGGGAFAVSKALFTKLEASYKEQLAAKDQVIKNQQEQLASKDKAIEWYRERLSK